MRKEDEKSLIKIEYENGTSMSVLSKKYRVNVNTIKTWSAKEKWVKKNRNITTKRGKTKKKKQPNKIVVDEKEVKIQRDILSGKSKEEIMRENEISNATYYRKSKNARQIRLARTEEYLDKIVDEVYPDLKTLLRNIEISKRNIIINVLKEVKETKNIKKINEIKKAYDNLKAMGNDLMRTGKLLTSYEVLEIDEQLSNEELQEMKLEAGKEEANNTNEIIENMIGKIKERKNGS
jgi:putative pbsx phage terminase small subunit|nr:MAG TPA: hypothetical protein [Caudoviricetes sp.]